MLYAYWYSKSVNYDEISLYTKICILSKCMSRKYVHALLAPSFNLAFSVSCVQCDVEFHIANDVVMFPQRRHYNDEEFWTTSFYGIYFDVLFSHGLTVSKFCSDADCCFFQFL